MARPLLSAQLPPTLVTQPGTGKEIKRKSNKASEKGYQAKILAQGDHCFGTPYRYLLRTECFSLLFSLKTHFCEEPVHGFLHCFARQARGCALPAVWAVTQTVTFPVWNLLPTTKHFNQPALFMPSGLYYFNFSHSFFVSYAAKR